MALGTSLDRLYFGSPSEAFLNQSEDFGETVVNCFMKLRELGVVKDVHSGMGEGLAQLQHCNYELSRLFRELREYEYRKEYYPDGDSYISQVRNSVINEINTCRIQHHGE